MTKLIITKKLMDLGSILHYYLQSFFGLILSWLPNHWFIDLVFVFFSLFFTDYEYILYKIIVCMFYLALYVLVQACLYLKHIYKVELKLLFENNSNLKLFLILFYKITNISWLLLFINNMYYIFCKLVITFLILYFPGKYVKIIIQIFSLNYLMIKAILIIIIEIVLSIKEKLLKSTLKDVFRWRLKSLFLSLCVLHIIVIYIGYYFIIFIFFFKIMLKYIELVFNKYVHAYDRTLHIGSKFYLPCDHHLSIFDRLRNSKIFLELIEVPNHMWRKHNDIRHAYSLCLLIQYMFIFKRGYHGWYIEDIYWYRPNYVYKNMYNVGLDLVALQDLNFFLNKVLFNCMYWRYLLSIAESRKKEEVNNIFEIGYDANNNRFYHKPFVRSDHDLFMDYEGCSTYDIWHGNDIKGLKYVLKEWLDLLNLCKNILDFLEKSGKNIFKLEYNLDVEYFLKYKSMCLSERIGLYIDINYKKYISLVDLNLKFKEKIFSLHKSLSLLDDNLRGSTSEWPYYGQGWAALQRMDVYDWSESSDTLDFNFEKLLKLNLKTVKSANLVFFEEELKYIGLYNLDVKKKKYIVYF